MSNPITVFHFGPIDKPTAIYTVEGGFSGIGVAKIGETSKIDGMVSYSIESGEVRLACLMDPRTKNSTGCGEFTGQDRFHWKGKVIRAAKMRKPKAGEVFQK